MNNSNRKKLFIVRRESGGIGGAEKVAHRFIKAFSTHFDTELIHAGKTINGVRIKGTKGPSWLKCLRFAKSARKFLDKQKDVLVLSMERGVPGTIYRAGDGVHKVWVKIKYQNSIKWVFNLINWILPNLEKISIEQSKCVVPNSSMVKAEMLEHYKISCEKINVIHNGYDPSIYYSLGSEKRLKLRSKLGMDNNDLNFLFSGSGWERKGLSAAISIFALILHEFPNSHFWVAGKGSPKKYTKLIKKKKLTGRVTFLGSVKNIWKCYQVCDLMILPTQYDPLSNTCLESLACGCPVITTEQNGVARIVKSVNGGIILKLTENLEFLSKKQISKLLDNQTRGRISKSVAECTTEKEIDKYLELLM